jgi:hypothetical protein
MLNVDRPVAEEISRIFVRLTSCSNSINAPAAIRMDQPPQELLRILAKQRFLPPLEKKLSLVLSTRTRLREEARPVLGVRVNLHDRRAPLPKQSDFAPRADDLHRLRALARDRRIDAGREDPQPPHASWVEADGPIAQVLAEQVRVLRRVQLVRSPLADGAAAGPGEGLGPLTDHPLPYRGPRDASGSGDLGRVPPRDR